MSRQNRQRGCILVAILLATTTWFSHNVSGAKGDAVDPKTKMVFPARIGAFVREGGIEYDALGYPTAKYFAGRMAFASVFYYKQNPFSVEYANARDAVKQVTPGSRLVSDVPSNLHPGGRRSVFAQQGNFLGTPNIKLMSELLMFPRRDLYLTLRITYRADHADRARQEIDAFVRGFRLP